MSDNIGKGVDPLIKPTTAARNMETVCGSTTTLLPTVALIALIEWCVALFLEGYRI